MIRKLSIPTSHFKMIKPLLMCFDFDYTIANENTDSVARQMYNGEIPESLKQLYKSGAGWTVYMRNIFELLHSRKISPESIKQKIAAIPATPGFEELLKKLHSHNCEIIIISDSNSVFIEEWLKHHQLYDTITMTFTNPAKFDANGLLHIEPYQNQDWCKLSEKNLCKGWILMNYIKERAENGVTFGKIAYAGDGSNDFCPMLKLSENDLVFPRENYPIIKLLNGSSEHIVKAQVIPWKNGQEIWQAITTNVNL